MKTTQTTGFCLLAGLLLLTGCATHQRAALAPLAGIAIRGSVHGGQQPVSGAVIQLYAAGNTGYGSAYPYPSGTSLLGSNSVVTDSSGGFNITGDYACPSASTNVYLVATGGNPGASNNPNIAVMAALGPCGALSASTFISINEVTTVASVWALAGFAASSGLSIGSSANNGTGLNNAFATVNKLANLSNGATGGPALPANAILPVARINTLANVLAACVNSGGGTAGDHSACGTLFTNTTVNGVVPTDTLAAARAIAQHPALNTANLYTLSSATGPFQPTLSSAPADFALALQYTGGNLSSPSGLALDSAGSVWIANAGNSTVTKLNNNGDVLSGTAGFGGSTLSYPEAIAVDPQGSVWVADTGNNTVTQLSSDGLSAVIYNGGGLDEPSALAIDASNTVWIANRGASTATQILAGGQSALVTGTSISSPTAIAINPK